MIHLLFGLVFLEMALVVVLLFKTPLRMLLMLGLDRMKRGRGRLVAGTLAMTMVVLFTSAVYNVLGDQVLMANNLLEASLMGKITKHALSLHV